MNEMLINQPDATFFMRVRGPSMRDAGIDDGDYVVIDRSIEAKHGQVVLAVVDGEFTIKRLFRRAGRVKLQAANPTFQILNFGMDKS
ncbi:LexA family protein [Alcaligenes aquatilis]|uniref:LexA family protein n=1 Tax=Alcaligenes aquatilis TaxID=323284 RepID=UPI003616429B